MNNKGELLPEPFGVTLRGVYPMLTAIPDLGDTAAKRENLE